MQNDKKQSIITNFICDEKNPSHIKKFNDGGLSRYSTISPIENVLSCMKKHLLHGSNNHYNAAKRLDIMLTATMMYLLLMCIITKLATTDLCMNFATTGLHMNIKKKPLSLSIKLLFLTTSFNKLN